MKFSTIAAAQSYLFRYRKSQKEIGIEDFKFGRVLHLAQLLGDPQNHINVIHVAGTSGKGSTSSTISHILVALGQKTGLSVSPHVLDVRERAQINNANLSEKVFLRYIEHVVSIVEEMRESEYGLPSFFEVMIILAYYIFAQEKVDYAVMETGLGGRLDATNVATAKNKIAVLTKIGLDHTDVLGDTIREIASQKAGIIHDGNIVISVKQRADAELSILTRASEMKTHVEFIAPHKEFSKITDLDGTLSFDFSYKEIRMVQIAISLSGVYQVENTAVALASCYEAARRDGFVFDETKIRKALLTITNPGRFDEILIGKKKIIIDGAHNPQKMSAFIKSLRKKYPNTQFDFLIAFKHGKDFVSILKYIVPHARKIFATEFILSEQVETMTADTVEDIENTLRGKFSFDAVESIRDVFRAFMRAQGEKDTILVVTGSLYLVSELYREMKKK